MKRSELKRRSGLKADPEKTRAWEAKSRAASLSRPQAPLARSAGLARGSGPKSKPKRLTASQRRLKEAWQKGAGVKPCEAPDCYRRSSPYPHHVIREQVILREVAPERRDAARWDKRNRLLLCDDCHAGHHGGDPLPVSVIRGRVFLFARDYGLTHILDRELARYQHNTQEE